MNSPIKLRVVIDSNVFISGYIWAGKPAKIIDLWLDDKFSLLISNLVITELITHLQVAQVNKNKIEEIIEIFKNQSTLLNPPKKVHICRDSTDNQILDLCLTGKADYLITGDKDLLVLKSFKNTKIVTPDFFLKNVVKGFKI